MVHAVGVTAVQSAVGLVCMFLALTGCATAYEPAASPRVTLTSAGIYKDGQHVGSLSYGTPDAVKGNARAESEASLGKNLSIAGWVFQVGAVGGLVTGAVVASNTTKQDVPTGLILGALTVSLIGDAMWLAGSTHSVNAINIYNDGLSLTP
jgi:hypothetical protein